MAERINKSNFDEKIAKGKVVVEFYSDSCIPCKKLNPVLASLEERANGAVQVLKVNINFDMEIAERYTVMSTPTLVLFTDGAEKDRKTGVQTIEVLEDWIK